MPDTYGPFDATTPETGRWMQAQWYRDAPMWAPSGVMGPPAATTATGDLPLTVNGLTVSVGLGRAHVRGAGYERTETPWSAGVPANTNATNSRVDRIVLRRDLAAKTVTPVLLQGSPAAQPAAPTIQQEENGQWDLPLFRFRVPPNSATALADVTDERVWIDPESGGTITPLGVNGGWTIPSSATPGVYLLSPHVAGLVGWFSNAGTFTPDGTQTPVTLPRPFRPKRTQVFAIPYLSGTTPGFVIGAVAFTGTVRLDRGPTIPAGAVFYLDSVKWHLTWTT